MIFIVIELMVLLMLSGSFIKMYKSAKYNKIYKILHILFWGIIFINSFYMERKFFTFDVNQINWRIYFYLKFSFLLFIVIAAKLSYDLGKQVLYQNKIKKNLLIVSLVYFTFCMLMLLIYYPGSWKWDEIWILYSLDNYVIGTSQHFLTSVLYSWGIMIFGSPVGVIILINAIISAILGYCASEIKLIYKTNKSMIIFIIPFMILPPIIDNNMYPLRHSLYSYLCMLLFLLPIIDGIKRRNNELSIFTIGKTAGYIIIITLVSSWRNEGIYYLVLPFILIIFFAKYISTRKKIALLICPIICTLLISSCQQRLSVSWNPDRNTIIVTLNFFYELLEKGQLSQQEMDSIDNVVDVNKLKTEGARSVWNGLIRDGEYSQEDFSEYKKVFVANVLRHPVQLAKIQWPIFKRSNGDIEYFSQSVMGYINIYDEEFLKTETGSNYIEFLKYQGIKVINENLREIYKKFILLLRDTKSGEVSKLYKYVYSCYLPVTVTLIYIIVLLLNKNFDCFIFALFSLGRLPIVYFTSPASAFMYYYPNYIIGIVAMILLFNGLFYRKEDILQCECKTP